jgi:hypothetical protein
MVYESTSKQKFQEFVSDVGMKMPYVSSKSKQADLILEPESILIEEPLPAIVKKSPKEEEKAIEIAPNKPVVKPSQPGDSKIDTKRSAFQKRLLTAQASSKKT